MKKKVCDKHRKHNPECSECLRLSLLVMTPRMGVKPEKVFKDKSKYTRKEKHKRSNDRFFYAYSAFDKPVTTC